MQSTTTIRASHVIAGILWLIAAGLLVAILVLLIVEKQDDYARACFGAELLCANVALVVSFKAIHEGAIRDAYRQGVEDGSHEADVRSIR